MNRVFACALVAALGNASAAFAGDTLLASGTRQVIQLASAPAATATAGAATVKSATGALTPGVRTAQGATPSYQAEPGPGNLSKSGHSKATKVMIYSALGAGFALSAWAIDHHVLNLTPSSLGQRKD
jgi:hypothetical protein